MQEGSLPSPGCLHHPRSLRASHTTRSQPTRRRRRAGGAQIGGSAVKSCAEAVQGTSKTLQLVQLSQLPLRPQRRRPVRRAALVRRAAAAAEAAGAAAARRRRRPAPHPLSASNVHAVDFASLAHLPPCHFRPQARARGRRRGQRRAVCARPAALEVWRVAPGRQLASS
jgi:hypothetical protein